MPAPRICIVTPGQLGSNPRVVKEAQAFHDAGYTVRVVAAKVMDMVEPRDQDVLDSSAWRTDRIDFSDPLRWKWLRGRQELFRRAAEVFPAHPRLDELAHNPMTPSLADAAMCDRADLYIAHYVAALPAAARAARRHGALYAFDAEDFHLGDLPDAPGNALDKRLIRAIEGCALPGCAYVTAASPGIADAYAETYGIARPTVTLNVFPRSHAPGAPTPRGTAEPGPSVYWFSQTIGPDRGLECAVRAIAASAARPHLYLRGLPARGFIDRLNTVAVECDVPDRIHVLASAEPSRLERMAATHDVGLVGEVGHTQNRRIALTNKIFSYLTSGLAVVATAIPAHHLMAREFGAAVRIYPVDDHQALARALDSFLLDPDRLAASRAEAWRLGQERFCWERESTKLLGLVGEVFAKSHLEPAIQ